MHKMLLHPRPPPPPQPLTGFQYKVKPLENPHTGVWGRWLFTKKWSCISVFWLLQNNQHIDDLFTDFCDGRLLISLLEIISGEKLGKVGKYYYYYYYFY